MVTLEKSLMIFITPRFPLLPCRPFTDTNLSLTGPLPSLAVALKTPLPRPLIIS